MKAGELGRGVRDASFGDRNPIDLVRVIDFPCRTRARAIEQEKYREW